MESPKTNQNGKYKYTNAKLRVKVENEYLPHINVNKISCLFFGNVTKRCLNICLAYEMKRRGGLGKSEMIG